MSNILNIIFIKSIPLLLRRYTNETKRVKYILLLRLHSMKKMRIPLLIALGVAIVGIIFGSFFDFQISQAIASPTNGFALTVSAIGPTIGFAGIAVMGGGFIALALKGKYHVALKVLFYVLAACCYGVSVYYASGEYFGVNGSYGAAPEWVGYFITAPIEAAAVVGGYFLFRNCQNKNMWIVFCSIIVLLLIVLVAAIPILKDNMHRPRYRLISVRDDIAFHNWWQPLSKDLYKSLTSEAGFVKDNLKSYPSGHTAEASILIVMVTFFPLADKRFEKYQLPAFLGSCALVLLVAFARILAAAHFLSDVSFGATITIVMTVIANEIIMRVKQVQLQEEQPVEEKKEEAQA